MDTGIAESKEFKMHGLLLSMRVLPVVPKPRGGCAVVILKDITELRKKDEELLIKSVVIKEIHHRVKNNLRLLPVYCACRKDVHRTVKQKQFCVIVSAG